MDKELQNLLDNYEQAIYGYTKPIMPSIKQIHLLLDYISQLSIQVKKQKEVIDKVNKYIKKHSFFVNDTWYNKKIGYPKDTFYTQEILDILKEVEK